MKNPFDARQDYLTTWFPLQKNQVTVLSELIARIYQFRRLALLVHYPDRRIVFLFLKEGLDESLHSGNASSLSIQGMSVLIIKIVISSSCVMPAGPVPERSKI